jgi:hypothetical protein
MAKISDAVKIANDFTVTDWKNFLQILLRFEDENILPEEYMNNTLHSEMHL